MVRWSISLVLAVLLALPAPLAGQSAAIRRPVADSPSPCAGLQKHAIVNAAQHVVPPGLRAKIKTGEEGKQHFMKQVSPQALLAGIRWAQQKGWNLTDSFTVLAYDWPDVKRTAGGQNQTFYDSNGSIAIWDFDTGSTTVFGAMITVTYWDGRQVTFNAQYDVTLINEYGGEGETTDAVLLESRTRERPPYQAIVPTAPAGGPRLLRVGADLPQVMRSCDRRTAWRQCYRTCLKKSLTRGLYVVGAAVGSQVKTCANVSTKVGWTSLFLVASIFIGCEAGVAGIAGGFYLIEQFYVEGGCDSPSKCGPDPGC